MEARRKTFTQYDALTNTELLEIKAKLKEKEQEWFKKTDAAISSCQYLSSADERRCLLWSSIAIITEDMNYVCIDNIAYKKHLIPIFLNGYSKVVASFSSNPLLLARKSSLEFLLRTKKEMSVDLFSIFKHRSKATTQVYKTFQSILATIQKNERGILSSLLFGQSDLTADDYHAAAIASHALNNTEQAIKYLQKALSLTPNCPYILSDLACYYHNTAASIYDFIPKEKVIKKGLAVCDQALTALESTEYKDSFYHEIIKSRIKFQKANLFYLLEEYEVAIELYDELIETWPNKEEVFIFRAKALKKLGYYSSAIDNYLIADTIHPTGQTEACCHDLLANHYADLDSNTKSYLHYMLSQSKPDKETTPTTWKEEHLLKVDSSSRYYALAQYELSVLGFMKLPSAKTFNELRSVYNDALERLWISYSIYKKHNIDVFTQNPQLKHPLFSCNVKIDFTQLANEEYRAIVLDRLMIEELKKITAPIKPKDRDFNEKEICELSRFIEAQYLLHNLYYAAYLRMPTEDYTAAEIETFKELTGFSKSKIEKMIKSGQIKPKPRLTPEQIEEKNKYLRETHRYLHSAYNGHPHAQEIEISEWLKSLKTSPSNLCVLPVKLKRKGDDEDNWFYSVEVNADIIKKMSNLIIIVDVDEKTSKEIGHFNIEHGIIKFVSLNHNIHLKVSGDIDTNHKLLIINRAHTKITARDKFKFDSVTIKSKTLCITPGTVIESTTATDFFGVSIKDMRGVLVSQKVVIDASDSVYLRGNGGITAIELGVKTDKLFCKNNAVVDSGKGLIHVRSLTVEEGCTWNPDYHQHTLLTIHAEDIDVYSTVNINLGFGTCEWTGTFTLHQSAYLNVLDRYQLIGNHFFCAGKIRGPKESSVKLLLDGVYTDGFIPISDKFFGLPTNFQELIARSEPSIDVGHFQSVSAASFSVGTLKRMHSHSSCCLVNIEFACITSAVNDNNTSILNLALSAHIPDLAKYLESIKTSLTKIMAGEISSAMDGIFTFEFFCSVASVARFIVRKFCPTLSKQAEILWGVAMLFYNMKRTLEQLIEFYNTSDKHLRDILPLLNSAFSIGMQGMVLERQCDSLFKSGFKLSDIHLEATWLTHMMDNITNISNPKHLNAMLYDVGSVLATFAGGTHITQSVIDFGITLDLAGTSIHTSVVNGNLGSVQAAVTASDSHLFRKDVQTTTIADAASFTVHTLEQDKTSKISVSDLSIIGKKVVLGDVKEDSAFVDVEKLRLQGTSQLKHSIIKAQQKVEIAKSASLTMENSAIIAKEMHDQGQTTVPKGATAEFNVENYESTPDSGKHGEGEFILKAKMPHLSGSIDVSSFHVIADKIKNVQDLIRSLGEYITVRPKEILHVSISETLTIKDPIIRTDISLFLEANNVDVYADVKAGKHLAIFAKQGPVVITRCTVGAEKTFVEAKSDIKNIGGTIVGTKFGQVISYEANVYNLCEFDAGQRDQHIRPITYTSGKMLGGTDGLYVQGQKIFGTASIFSAKGNVYLYGKNGIELTPLTHTYESAHYKKRSGWFGFNSREVVEYKTQIAKSTVASNDGKIYMKVDKGNLTSVATDFVSKQGSEIFHSDINGIVQLLDAVGTTQVIESGSTCWGAFSESSDAKDQFSVPTFVANYDKGKTIIHSAGTFESVSTLFFCPGELDIKARNVFMTDRTLNHSIHTSRTGFSASFMGFPIFGNASKVSFLPAELHTEIHTIPEAVLTAYNLAGSAESLFNQLGSINLIGSALQRLIPSSATVGISTQKTDTEFQTQAGSKIITDKLTVTADEKIKQTVSMEVTDATYQAKVVEMSGHQLHSETTTKQTSVSITQGLGAPPIVSASSSQAKIITDHYEPIQLKVGGELSITAQEVHFSDVEKQIAATKIVAEVITDVKHEDHVTSSIKGTSASTSGEVGYQNQRFVDGHFTAGTSLTTRATDFLRFFKSVGTASSASQTSSIPAYVGLPDVTEPTERKVITKPMTSKTKPHAFQEIGISPQRVGYILSEKFAPKPKVQILYRGDSRMPGIHTEGEKIFVEKGGIFDTGFKAKGANTDWKLHVLAPGQYSNPDSAYISATPDPEIAVTFFGENNKLKVSYVYEIQSFGNTLNIPAMLEAAKESLLLEYSDAEIRMFQSQNERAFEEHIKPSEIRGCREVNIDIFGDPHFSYDVRTTVQDTFIPNPNFTPPNFAFIKLWQAGKFLGHALNFEGAIFDGYSFYRIAQTGDHKATSVEIARIATAWPTAFATAAAFAKAGAAICASFTPIVTVGCSILGGFVGGGLGYSTGSAIGGEMATKIYDAERSKSASFIFFNPTSQTSEFVDGIELQRKLL